MKHPSFYHTGDIFLKIILSLGASSNFPNTASLHKGISPTQVISSLHHQGFDHGGIYPTDAPFHNRVFLPSLSGKEFLTIK